MKAFITALSYTPIEVDITSTSDAMPKVMQVGYTIDFYLITSRFEIKGQCDLREYPLSNKQIQSKLIAALEEDFLEASAEGIEPIIK